MATWSKTLAGWLIGLVLQTAPAAAREPAPDSLAAAPPAVHGAVLELSETVHDFGDVPRRGGDLSCEITFTNRGDAPLVLSRLVTSNSCLKATCSRRPVAPGRSGVIRIVYQPLKSEAGSFSRVIRIGSNAQAGDTQITVCGHSFESEVPVRKTRHGRTKVRIKERNPKR